jgi:hypothetical protein
MKTINGTVRFENLEGGIWVIDTGRDIYQLEGGPEELYQEGRVVKIKGEIRKDMVSFGMVGPIFEVKEIE